MGRWGENKEDSRTWTQTPSHGLVSKLVDTKPTFQSPSPSTRTAPRPPPCQRKKHATPNATPCMRGPQVGWLLALGEGLIHPGHQDASVWQGSRFGGPTAQVHDLCPGVREGTAVLHPPAQTHPRTTPSQACQRGPDPGSDHRDLSSPALNPARPPCPLPSPCPRPHPPASLVSCQPTRQGHRFPHLSRGGF